MTNSRIDKMIRQFAQRIYGRIFDRRLRVCSSDDLKRDAIVFAPHQDDETLGCGGTIIQKVRAGARVFVVFLTDGSTSHAHLMPASELAQMREQEARTACKRLGIPERDVLFLRFTDGELARDQDLAIKRVIELLQDRSFEEVYIPYQREPQSDHIAANQIVKAALAHTESNVTVFEYLVWTWYQWPWVGLDFSNRSALKQIVKNTLALHMGLTLLLDMKCAVEIAQCLPQKREALQQHRTQMFPFNDEPQWPTLRDVADGEWLAHFFESREIFCSYPSDVQK